VPDNIWRGWPQG